MKAQIVQFLVKGESWDPCKGTDRWVDAIPGLCLLSTPPILVIPSRQRHDPTVICEITGPRRTDLFPSPRAAFDAEVVTSERRVIGEVEISEALVEALQAYLRTLKPLYEAQRSLLVLLQEQKAERLDEDGQPMPF